MKKKLFLIFLLMQAFVTAALFAVEKIPTQPYELDKMIHDIDSPCGPVVSDDYIIFTADYNYRYVGIAFDFENYKVIHPFKVLTRKDDNNVAHRSMMFYVYKREHKFTSLKYRLVLDGLWTIDPYNPNKEYDYNTNLYFSKVEDLNSIKIATGKSKTDGVHFVYKGESGQKIHLTGDFCNWDPWIYQLKETKPGLYELDLPLAEGKYLYTYYIGFTPVLDETNPQKAYSADGRSVNVLTVSN